MFRLLALMLVSSLLSAAQTRTTYLLREIVSGPSPAIAEEKLEKEGRAKLDVGHRLYDELPVVLADEKELYRTWLLARLAGVLKVSSAIPSLCELLCKGTKSYSTTLYQAAELKDDPVALALPQIGAPAVLPVSRVLASPNPDTRIRAMRALSKIATPESQEALQIASRTEKDPVVLSVLGTLLKE